MLKDRYTFEMGPKAAAGLLACLQHQPHNSPLYALVWLSLKGLVDRLTLFSAGYQLRPNKKIALNKKEALAFHIGYKQGYFFKDEVVQEIFTEIDRTINK